MQLDGETLPDDLALELQKASPEARDLVLRLIEERYLQVPEEEEWWTKLGLV